MVKVKLTYLLPFSGLTGRAKDKMEFSTEPSLEELLVCLTERYGSALGKYFFNKNDEFEPQCLVLVNRYATQDLETTIKDGDEVSLAPPLGGG